MKNILMIGPDASQKGGISTVIKNFEKSNFPIIFKSSWESNHRIREFFKILVTLRFQIFRNKIGIVHFQVAQKGSFYRKAILVLLVPKHVKIVFHIHASHFDIFYEQSPKYIKNWIHRCLNRCDQIIAVSQQWKEYYETLTKTKVTYVHNAVACSEQNLFSANSKHVVTLGKMGERKGSFDIVEVAKEILMIDSEITFDLYGDGQVEELEELTKNIPNIRVHTWLAKEDFFSQLQNTTLHLLPSYHEGLPMSILETMSWGIPNIASDVGGVSAVVKNEKNGYLMAPGDKQQMVQLILAACQQPQVLERMSIDAKKTIEENFSLSHYFDQWAIIYYSL